MMSTNQQHQVRLSHNKERIEFSCRQGQSIAKAAQAVGIELTLGCMQSRCMTCRAKLQQGKVKSIRHASRYAALDPADIDGGFVLLCSVTAEQDVVLEPASPWLILDK